MILKYIFHGNNIIERTENSEFTLLLNKNNSYQLALNSTGMTIYNLLQKYDSTEEVVDIMHEAFSDVPYEDINDDVLEIFDSLAVYGIVEFTDDNIADIHSETRCEFSGDKTYRKCYEFIKNNGYGNMNMFQYALTDDFQNYSPVSLRLRVMKNIEYQVFVLKGDCVIAFMSFSNSPEGVSKVVSIKDLIFKLKLSEQELLGAFTLMIDKAVSMCNKYNEISKVRLSILSDENCRLKEIISELGFHEEAYLQNEMKSGDIQFITKVIQ